MSLSRRGLFAAGAAVSVGVVAGCAPRPQPKAAPSTPPPVDPAAVARGHLHDKPTQWGVKVDGVVDHVSPPGIALTLDACGGPTGQAYDQALIDGLIARNVPATLFLNGRWIEANPELAQNLARNPLFEIANHGTQHLPLSVNGQSAYGIPGTRSVDEVVREVYDNHLRIARLCGRPPQYFRAGTAHYDDAAVAIVGDLGETVAGFSVNADNGAQSAASTVRWNVGAAVPGDIVLAHMNQPGGGTAPGLLAGVDDQLARGALFCAPAEAFRRGVTRRGTFVA